MKCDDRTVLLDYFELFDIESNYKYSVPAGNADEKLAILLTRLKKINYPRYLSIQSLRHHIQENLKFVKGIKFGTIKDQINFTNWSQCQVKTLAKAVNPTKRGRGIFVDLRLWEELDSRSKAGFYLNYLLNLESTFYDKETTTVFTRYFNSILASDKVDDFFDLKGKISLHQRLKAPTMYHDGVFYNIYNESFGFSDIRIKNNLLIKSSSSSVPLKYRELGFQPAMKFNNTGNMKFGLQGGYSLDFTDRSREYYFLRSIRPLSGCIGPFKIPNVEATVFFTHNENDGSFDFLRVRSHFWIYKGRYVEEVYYENGKIKLKFSDDVRGSPLQEISDC